jgi:hypothetical protein
MATIAGKKQRQSWSNMLWLVPRFPSMIRYVLFLAYLSWKPHMPREAACSRQFPSPITYTGNHDGIDNNKYLKICFQFLYFSLMLRVNKNILQAIPSIADPHLFDADPDPTFHCEADADPTFHCDADSDPDSNFKMKAQNLEKVFMLANIPKPFWLVICKLMQIRIRSSLSLRCGCESGSYGTFQFDANPSGSTTLFVPYRTQHLDRHSRYLWRSNDTEKNGYPTATCRCMNGRNLICSIF